MTQAITAGLNLDASIPLPALPRLDGTERRTCGLALLWWQDLAGDRRAPSRQDIAAAPAPDAEDAAEEEDDTVPEAEEEEVEAVDADDPDVEKAA